MEEASLQEIPRRKSEVKNMIRNIIFIAGLVIACVVCAGIPAVAAAENHQVQVISPVPAVQQEVQPAAGQTTAPAPWYKPITDVLGIPQQAQTSGQVQQTTSQSQNTPADTTTATQKNWWEKFWPLQDNKEAAPQGNGVTAQDTNNVLTPDPGTVKTTTTSQPQNEPEKENTVSPQNGNNQKEIPENQQTPRNL
jgi:hypothetical protein